MFIKSIPNNVINAGIPIEGCVGNFCNELAIPVFPTAFYEVIMGVILFGFLWSIRKLERPILSMRIRLECNDAS